MNAIDELINEHEAVRLTLRILKRISDEVSKSGKISNPEHLDQLFDFFSTFVDRCHHSKEEEIVLQKMSAGADALDGLHRQIFPVDPDRFYR